MQDLQAITTMLGFIVGAIGVGLGLWQYRRNQIWRETEFVANETKAFFDNQNISNALKILDRDDRKIEVAPGKIILVTRSMLRAALACGPDATTFSDDEAIIRDIFDDFLVAFERFEQFIKAGVIEFYQLRPYFRFWAGLLAGKRLQILDNETLACIWAYMKDYDYTDAIRLLERYHPRRNLART
jgi:hypothetical protein